MFDKEKSYLIFPLIIFGICGLMYMCAFHSERNSHNKTKQELIELKENCKEENSSLDSRIAN